MRVTPVCDGASVTAGGIGQEGGVAELRAEWSAPVRTARGHGVTSPVPPPSHRFDVERAGRVLAECDRTLAALCSATDAGQVPADEAGVLFGRCVATERRLAAAKLALTRVIAASDVADREGARDAATYLAGVEQVPVGKAKRSMALADNLQDLPATAEALRSGEVSLDQASEIARAARGEDPSVEGELLDVARTDSLTGLKNACRRVKASSPTTDHHAIQRRHHEHRHFRSWTDDTGAFRYEGSDTADRGARIMALLSAEADRHFQSAREAGREEGPLAYAADALATLIERGATARPGSDPSTTSTPACGEPAGGEPACGEPAGGEPAGAVTPARGVETTVVIHVDLDILFGDGSTPRGGLCEIAGASPVPIPAAMARDLASDATLKLCFAAGGDIRSVFHFGRTINAQLRTALEARDRCCVVPGCNSTFNLEIDHLVPFARGGPTTLENLARICRHHHRKKTYDGWNLWSDAAGWHFTPPDRPLTREAVARRRAVMDQNARRTLRPEQHIPMDRPRRSTPGATEPVPLGTFRST